MIISKKILIVSLKVVLPGGIMAGLAWWLLGGLSGSALMATPRLLMGMACLVGAAGIIALPFARLIAGPAAHFLFPGMRFSRPQPMYSVPKSMRARGMYEDAMMALGEIAQEYPGEPQTYMEMIDIAIVELGDAERAAAIYEQGMSTVKKEQDREVLTGKYHALQTRLDDGS